MTYARDEPETPPLGSKWPQTPERIGADIVEGWRNDGADDAELARRIAHSIEGDRDATRRLLTFYGLGRP